MQIITNDEIKELPLIHFEGDIIICQDNKCLSNELDHFLKRPMIGLDTEQRPSFTKGVRYPISLIQISSEDRCLLIQVQKTGPHEKLSQLLSNPDILKIGLALHDDIKELQRIFHFVPQGMVHLDKIAKQKGLKRTGLRYLTAQFLKHRISKKAQTSNWSKDELSESQIRYAATDAWICLKIYPELNSMNQIKIEGTKNIKKDEKC